MVAADTGTQLLSLLMLVFCVGAPVTRLVLQCSMWACPSRTHDHRETLIQVIASHSHASHSSSSISPSEGALSLSKDSSNLTDSVSVVQSINSFELHIRSSDEVTTPLCKNV